MDKKEKQEERMAEMKKKDQSLPALPFCGGKCDECEYRAKEWSEILGEEIYGYETDEAL